MCCDKKTFDKQFLAIRCALSASKAKGKGFRTYRCSNKKWHITSHVR